MLGYCTLYRVCPDDEDHFCSVLCPPCKRRISRTLRILWDAYLIIKIHLLLRTNDQLSSSLMVQCCHGRASLQRFYFKMLNFLFLNCIYFPWDVVWHWDKHHSLDTNSYSVLVILLYLLSFYLPQRTLLEDSCMKLRTNIKYKFKTCFGFQ